MPVISVVMPVYNREVYLRAAVESILCQTYGDFEFIIVNDGSTDGATDILREYAARETRIVLIEQPNGGYTRALNRGLEVARGEFVARMDSDDISQPERFALQAAYLREHPEVVAVGGQAIQIDEDGDDVCAIVKRPGHEEIERRLLGQTSESGGCLLHPSVMMRRRALMEVGGYRAEFEPAEDNDLWLRLSEVGRLGNIPETVLKYRVHSASASRERAEQQQANGRRAIEDAYRRRGLVVPERIEMRARSPHKDEIAQREDVAMTAARHGYSRTARKQAWRVLIRRPWRRRAWKAMTIGLLGAEIASGLGRVRRRLLRRPVDAASLGRAEAAAKPEAGDGKPLACATNIND